MAVDEICVRCRRPVPPIGSEEYCTWDALVDESGDYLGIVCPNCVTGEEQAAMYEDMADLIDSLSRCARCSRPSPEGDPEDLGWQLVVGELVCPACRTTEDVQRAIRDDKAAAALLHSMRPEHPKQEGS